jgi:hypothetical protein
MTGQSKRENYPDKVLRRHFETAVFSQLLWDLKSGDLYLEGSDQYADYREQLISWEEYAEQLEAYGTQVAHPTDGKALHVDPEGLALLERIVAERLKPISILHAVMHSEQWLNWTRFFAPLPGHASKLDHSVARYLAIAFCYGCNLGPSQKLAP